MAFSQDRVAKSKLGKFFALNGFMKNKLPKIIKNENSKIWNDNQRRALLGEKMAARYLKKQGYRILTSRFWTRYGEIDLVAQKRKILAFVEVKTRSLPGLGDPLEAITLPKFERLQRAAVLFLQKWKNLPQDYEIEYLGIGVRLQEPKEIVDMVRIFFD